MEGTIGKKIKKLRKELNMTQSQLAEPEMTKSMLSHIENGNANPSMKALQYIALKLNKPVAYFLQDDEDKQDESNDEISLLNDKVIDALEYIDILIKDKKIEFAKNKIETLLKTYKFNKESKIYADILFRLGKCCVILKDFYAAEEYLKSCSEIYIKNYLYVDGARAILLLTKKYLHNYKYNECLEIIEKANELYRKSTNRDIFFEIEILAEMPSITVAQGDFEKTVEICNKAIKLSHENNIYYLIDVSYRLLAITYLLQGELDKFVINMSKALKYVEFTNNKYILARISQNFAMYYNMINAPIEALQQLEIYKKNTEERAFYYYLELAKAKYLLGKYEEALEELNKINFNEKIYYLIDCIYIITSKVLKGLIYGKLKAYDEAVDSILESIKEIEPYTKLEYKGFVRFATKELSIAYKGLSNIYSLKNDYEKAYIYLNKSVELNKNI